MCELTEHDDIVQDCDCHKCALAERDRLRGLYELSELVRTAGELTIRGLYGENYELKQELLELRNQIQQLRKFRVA